MPNTFKRVPSNWMEEAVRIVGGPTKTANLLLVSGNAINRMMKEGRMPTDTEEARHRVLVLSTRTGIAPMNLVGFGQPFVSDGTELDRKEVAMSGSKPGRLRAGILQVAGVAAPAGQMRRVMVGTRTADGLLA